MRQAAGRATNRPGHPGEGGRPRRRPLRPRRRSALRRDQRVHQVDSRFGRRRRAALPGPDDRGRRGPALHRATPHDARQRGRRRWPTRPRCSRRSPRPRRSQLIGLPEARINLAQATIHLALAPKSNAVVTAIGAGAGRCPGRARPVPCRRPARRALPAAPPGSATAALPVPARLRRRASSPSSTRRTSSSAATTTCPAGTAPSGVAERLARLRAILRGAGDEPRTESDNGSAGRVNPPDSGA